MSQTRSTHEMLPQWWFVVTYVFAGLAAASFVAAGVSLETTRNLRFGDISDATMTFSLGSTFAAFGLSALALLLALVVLATDRSKRALICLGIVIVVIVLGYFAMTYI